MGVHSRVVARGIFGVLPYEGSTALASPRFNSACHPNAYGRFVRSVSCAAEFLLPALRRAASLAARTPSSVGMAITRDWYVLFEREMRRTQVRHTLATILR